MPSRLHAAPRQLVLSLASRLSRDYALRHWQIQRPTGLLWFVFRIFGFLPAFDAIGRRPIADDVCHKAAAEEVSTYSPRDASDGRSLVLGPPVVRMQLR